MQMDKKESKKTNSYSNEKNAIKFAIEKLNILTSKTRDLVESISKYKSDKNIEGEYFKALRNFVDYLEPLITTTDNGMNYFEVENMSTYNALTEAIKEKNVLRVLALMTQIHNYLAHSLDHKYESRNIGQQLFGLKYYTMQEIVKFCNRRYRADGSRGYDGYGITQDENRMDKLVVDVPMCGQISWHLGSNNNLGNTCQKYPYKTYYGSSTSNMKKLKQTVRISERGILSDHDMEVISAFNLAEVEGNLKSMYGKYSKDPVAQKLCDFLGQNPSIEPSDVENVDGLVASKIPNRTKEGRFEI